MQTAPNIQPNGDQQLILLSLALCSKLRPGFDQAFSKLAEQFPNGLEYFLAFKSYNEHVKPDYLIGVDEI